MEPISPKEWQTVFGVLPYRVELSAEMAETYLDAAEKQRALPPERLQALRAELLGEHHDKNEQVERATREHRHAPSTVQDHKPSGLLAHLVAERKKPTSIDPQRDPELRARIAPAIEARHEEFPNLRPEDWEPVGDADKGRNCHAHSVGVDRWLQPQWEFDIWYFDELFEWHGFESLNAIDLSLTEGMEKVVVYALQPDDPTYRTEISRYIDDERFGGGPLVQHSARQEPDGTWTMKLDEDGVIRVADPNVVNGPKYGRPFRVYVRPRT